MTDPHSRAMTQCTARHRAILDHVARHRITTNKAVQRMCLPQLPLNAVTKVTARLGRAGLLAKYPLIHPRAYYTLGPQAPHVLGTSSSRTSPLGPQALPTEYAALAYAVLGTTYHRRLNAPELKQQCPWLTEELLDNPHCLDQSRDPPMVELIRVDLGGKSDHVARKCDADIQARRQHRQFDPFVRQGRFRLVVITGTPEKATAIQTAVSQHFWPDGLQIHLVVVPELLLLTARPNGGP